MSADTGEDGQHQEAGGGFSRFPATTRHRSPSAAEHERQFVSSAASGRRDARTSAAAGGLFSERKPLAAAASAMTTGDFPQSAPLFAHGSRRGALHKALCFVLLALQGGALDCYLIAFTDLTWCAWIATDLVVLSGWAVFFVKNARSKRERACGFRQKGSASGRGLGEFTYAYLAWLVYVMACAPKVVLVLETSILDLVALRAPCGVTGFGAAALLSAPLLYCLTHAVLEDPNGAARHRSRACFLGTCADLLDGFTLLEALLRGELPARALQVTVVAAYCAALGVPVLWLHELTASEPRCRWAWARFLGGAAVDAPLLAVRCVQVFVHGAPVSVFMFKNAFFLACACLELVEQCLAVGGARRFANAGDAAQFSHGVSENDMCPHGYVNTLAVTAQS